MDVLIAGLILLGATVWLAYLAIRIGAEGDLERAGVCALAAFLATQITRRADLTLDLGTTAIAAVIAGSLVFGISGERFDQPLEPEMLIVIGAGALGAVAGALTSKRPRRRLARLWRVLAAGFGSFGAGLLMVGIVIVMTSTPSDATAALAVIGGAIIGNFLVALRIEVGGRACALGLMLVFAISLATDTDDAGLAMLGLALIACLAAIGGAIGARVRRSREAPPDLPAAQVR